MGFDGFAHRQDLPAGVDDADARRLRPGLREIGAPHALEKGAVLALEAIERFSGSGEPLPRHLVDAVEDQRPVGPQTGVYRIAEPPDQLQGDALARALVGRGGVREAVTDHPVTRA